jgi:hypothetical protein
MSDGRHNAAVYRVVIPGGIKIGQSLTVHVVECLHPTDHGPVCQIFPDTVDTESDLDMDTALMLWETISPQLSRCAEAQW